MILGLMGTAQVDSDTTLIRILDLAEQNDGIKFNGAVIRRGLKSLINMDFRLEKWGVLVSDTYKQVLDRFVDGDDSTSANDFYVIMISQVFQKLLRTSQTKFKIKDTLPRAVWREHCWPLIMLFSNLIRFSTPSMFWEHWLIVWNCVNISYITSSNQTLNCKTLKHKKGYR